MNNEEAVSRLTFPSFLAGSSNLEQSRSISELFQKDGTNADTLIQDREISSYIVIVLITVTTVLLLVCYLLFQCFKCQRDVFGKSSSKPSFETIPSSEPIPHPKRIYEIQVEEGCRPRLPTWPGKLPLGVRSLPSGFGDAAMSSSMPCANTSLSSTTSSKRVETGSLESLARSKNNVKAKATQAGSILTSLKSESSVPAVAFQWATDYLRAYIGRISSLFNFFSCAIDISPNNKDVAPLIIAVTGRCFVASQWQSTFVSYAYVYTTIPVFLLLFAA